MKIAKTLSLILLISGSLGIVGIAKAIAPPPAKMATLKTELRSYGRLGEIAVLQRSILPLLPTGEQTKLTTQIKMEGTTLMGDISQISQLIKKDPAAAKSIPIVLDAPIGAQLTDSHIRLFRTEAALRADLSQVLRDELYLGSGIVVPGSKEAKQVQINLKENQSETMTLSSLEKSEAAALKAKGVFHGHYR